MSQQHRSYLSSVVAAITDLHNEGQTSLTWQEVIDHLRDPQPAAQAEVSALLGSSGDRRTICDMLIEGGLLVVQTNDRYTTDFLRSTYLPERLTPEFVRTWLGLFGAGAGTGIRICEDSTDPFWVAKQMFEQGKFGGGVNRRTDLAIDVAEQDGNTDGAKAIIQSGMRAAYPDRTNDGAKRVLSTTAPRLLSDTYKGKPLVTVPNPDGDGE